jgi:hypothetical protein
MHATAVRQPGVNERHRIIQTPTYRGSQALGEPAYIAFVRESEVGQFKAGATINEDLIRTVDQDIGHTPLPEQWLQHTRPDTVSPQRLHGIKHRRVADGKALGSHGNRHIARRVLPTERDQAITDDVQRRGVYTENTG